jgi:hypothetical protein
MQEPEHRDLQPLLDTQQNQLSLVFAAGDDIDNKALAILATNVALVLFAAQTTFSTWQIFIILGFYAASLAYNLVAIWPRKYVGASIDLDQHPEYLGYDQDSLVLQLIADTKDAITVNSTLNTKRWHFCAWSLVLTGLGTLVLIVLQFK